jgi:Protein of unknown function (DUF1223)
MRAAIIGFAFVTVLATSVQAQEAPIVVVLFTSQGCSSCPPADAFLTDLAHQRRDVLPLAFHVIYRDNLGWKDPYSLDAATARQREYARHFGEDGVYTPQMVVDGTKGFVGFSRAEGLSAIAGAARKQIPVSVTREAGSLLIMVGAGVGKAQVLLVGFDPTHETPVGRGENRGHTVAGVQRCPFIGTDWRLEWVGGDVAAEPARRGWLRRAASSRGRSHPRGRSASILTACRFFAETATGSRECWPGRASRDPRDAFGFCCISRNEDRDRSGLLHRLAFARGAGDPASGEHGHG